jgi:hypothetical protein
MKLSKEIIEGPLRQNRDNYLESTVTNEAGEDVLILVCNK